MNSKLNFLTALKELSKEFPFCYTKTELLDEPQRIKLHSYSNDLGSLFFWKYRTVYLNLCLDFINSTISGDEFMVQFFELRLFHIRNFSKILEETTNTIDVQMNFPLDSRAFNFDNIYESIFEDCENFVSDELLEEIEQDEREINEIDETELKNRITKETINIIKLMIDESDKIDGFDWLTKILN